jgi:hypothetical protein
MVIDQWMSKGRKMTHRKAYHSYMVRIYRQMQKGGIHSQITLEDIQTGKRRAFTDIKELFDFLQNEINGELPMDNPEDMSHEVIA